MQQQQYLKQNQRVLNTQTGFAGTGAKIMSSAGSNGKDLIIRMLAEVFQVNNNYYQTDGFQQQGHRAARWEQVSSSLVPVSLYSRTTSRWLDYLLTASSVANSNTTSAMSPDSRDFLLLLQQFHQQNRQPTNVINSSNRLNNQINFRQQQQLANDQMYQQQDSNSVVFQVVAHDFIDGQCKKVLNVKLTQPGTRFGLASDYFVYWKEQQPINNMQSNSNYLMRQQQQNYNNRYQTNARTACCQQQQINDSIINQHTWGLNFASVNDAKLFYDICSLNLVDLDFNSDYLKLLALSDRNVSVCQTPTSLLPPSSSQQQQQLFSMQKNKRNNVMSRQQCYTTKNISNNKQQHLCQLQQLSKENSINKQLSKCLSCRQEMQQQRKRAPSKNSNIENFNTAPEVCPIHSHNNNNNDLTRENSASMRTRSRSSTRRPLTNSQERAQNESLKRARSFSTPASPEHKDEKLIIKNCPVHSKQQQNNFTQSGETHHPRCTSLINKNQKELLKKQSASDSEGPLKPARGVLRSDINQFSNRAHRNNIQDIRINLQQSHFSSLPSDCKQTQAKTKFKNQFDTTNHQVPIISNNELTSFQKQGYYIQQNLNKQWSSESKEGFDINRIDFNNKLSFEDQQATKIFNNSRANQRRSTGYDIENIDHFDAHNRNARLARAQYANSKNMKEFLSLDAGGVQSTPTRLEGLNERFDQKSDSNNNRSTYAVLTASSQQQNNIHNTKDHLVHKTRSSNYNQQPNEMSTFHAKGETLSRYEGGNSNDASIKMGVSNNFVDSAEIDEVKNVATTTDDLPLDSTTRKRMLKLSSEEKKSQKQRMPIYSSETKEYNRGINAEEDDSNIEQRNFIQPDAKISKVDLRGRVMRSDVGRRRSLERSMCVDLDSTLPNNKFSSSFKKSPCCLSPLPQSTTPLHIDSTKSSPSNYQVESNFLNLNNELKEQPSSAACEFATKPKRARTKSSGEGECCLNNKCQPNSCYDKKRDVYYCHHQLGQLTTDSNVCFKSSKSCNDLRGIKPDYYDYGDNYQTGKTAMPNSFMVKNTIVGANSRYPQHHHFSNTYGPATSNPLNVPKISGLSSYAVPLCFGEDKENFSHRHDLRQCQSCPNSLRRKRRDLVHNDEMFHHHHYSTHNQQQNINYSPQFEHIQNQAGEYASSHINVPQCCYQSCLANVHPRPSSACQAGGAFSNDLLCGQKQFTNCNLCSINNRHFNHSDNSYPNRFSLSKEYQKSTDRQQEQVTNGREVYACQCINCNNVLEENKSQVDCLHLSNLHRPFSSQSSKSPLRFGLYESDTEDEETTKIQIPSCKIIQQNSNPSQHQLFYATNQKETQGTSFNRSTSAYFRPGNIKPIQGYDQTMNRALLKNRQRAKSQPPAVDRNDSSFHLTKSIENVQKLIKEVQNELNIIKCRPISGLDSISNIGPCSVGLSNLIPISDECEDRLISNELMLEKPNQKNKEGYISASKEENAHQNDLICHQLSGNGAQQQTEDMTLLGGTTSATRRAGQFKCVGAIRKAGFLSVKKWILKRRQSIELARKQGWKRYWVCLRGTTLLFHSVVDKKDVINNINGYADNQTDLLSWIQSNCTNQMKANLLEAASINNDDDNDHNPQDKDFIQRSMSQCYIEREPRHLIIIDAAIAQPIPEHPKRDFVFCLSTTFGDAYLFQASCQLESDNWISAIHNACAASIARDFTRDEAIKLFESKIRHLEIESEKKLFLRQRLESRLTSMSSMSHIGALEDQTLNDQTSSSFVNTNRHKKVKNNNELSEQDAENKKITMRTLLQRLNQQLLALDNYIEQLHCEIYQLRCYLSSCGVQNLFYQNIQQTLVDNCAIINTSHLTIELPHPKSLLMHVSKPTKLLLIKMGVFTVSSFHAYIHARQGSADSILQKIQQASIQHVSSGAITNDDKSSSPIELMIKSHSVSEALNDVQNNKLENDTEELIRLSNIKAVSIKVNRILYNKIKKVHSNADVELELPANESDDRYSLHSDDEFVIINIRLHSNTNCLSIIKQVLKIIKPKSGGLDFLEYYIQFNTNSAFEGKERINKQSVEDCLIGKNSLQYVAKRRDTLNDWNNFEYLELMEKIVFEVELTRQRTDEASSPYGILIGAQLFANNYKNMLNVFCSYIEWGSVADKASLKDDDEFLVINGVPVMDLDMMFIECIIRDESKLKLVIRSSRTNCPDGAISLSHTDSNLKSDNDDDDDDDGDGNGNESNRNLGTQTNYPTTLADVNTINGEPSQLITDEYISTLVCPPPPAPSSAFLRTDSNMLRQKSDLSEKHSSDRYYSKQNSKTEPLITSKNCLNTDSFDKFKAKSQQNLNNSEELVQGNQELLLSNQIVESHVQNNYMIENNNESSANMAPDLATHLLKKTEQLTQLLGRNNSGNSFTNDESFINTQATSKSIRNDNKEILSNSKQIVYSNDSNSIERLKKSIIELFETEYAYIKHLETIKEHYMNPLEEIGYLEIQNLRHLNRIIVHMIEFQKDFFDKLKQSNPCYEPLEDYLRDGDEIDDINKIVQQLDSIKTTQEFIPILSLLARVFPEEADKFKIYTNYCAAYSKLQKLLHPRRGQSNPLGLNSNSIVTIPNCLDTFHPPSVVNISTDINNIGNTSNHREFLKPLGTFITNNIGNNNNDSSGQLKQLNEFLSNLDSSSSSASISLPRTSSTSSNTMQHEQTRSSDNNQKVRVSASTTTSTSTTNHSTFQRCVHQQNFESYLIKPIQRIVKYPMLLNSIALSAQALNVDDKGEYGLVKDLLIAVKQMESIASYVNDNQRVYDEYGVIFEHIERQYFDQQAYLSSRINSPPPITGPHQPLISLSIEQLLYFGTVNWLNVGEFTSKLKKGTNLTQILFVFNSCVVFICKEQIKSTKKNSQTNIISNNIYGNNNLKYNNRSQLDNFDNSNGSIRYQSLIPVSEVLVRSVPVTGSDKNNLKQSTNNKGYQWELFRCSSVNSNSSLLTKQTNKRNSDGKVYYLLSSPTNESRSAFLRKIRYIIRESVQNLCLPLARSPSSKSLTPKKLSSPTFNTTTNTNATSSSCSQSTSLSPKYNDNKNDKHRIVVQSNQNTNGKLEKIECKEIKTKQTDNQQFTSSIIVNN